ncbi:MAG TPA: GH25 family lysozyme, partial [Candidatus Limnocylindrales bacterium]
MSSRSVLAAVLAVAVVFGSSAVTAPASATTYLEGVDVSHWQGTIDWTKVAGAGKAFAMMKATDGETFVDSMYSTNHAGARAAGVRVGAYHFAEPSSTAAEAIVQADWFVNHIGYLPGDLVPALDLEVTDGLSASQLQAWVGYWLNEVTAKLGIKPMIYTSPSFWRTYMGDTATFANQGYTVLWVAHWFVTTPSVPANNWGGHSWTFWQYTNCGTVSGISGCVDLDRYNGTDLTPVTYRVTDTTGPTVVAPASRVYAVTTLGGTTTVPVTTYWSATDPSGIASYTLER